MVLEKLAHFDREVIPERRMHAKGSGALGTFTVTHDLTRCTKARIFSTVGKKADCFVRLATVAGERGSSACVKPHALLARRDGSGAVDQAAPELPGLTRERLETGFDLRDQ
jgi:hypothetical protein